MLVSSDTTHPSGSILPKNLAQVTYIDGSTLLGGRATVACDAGFESISLASLRGLAAASPAQETERIASEGLANEEVPPSAPLRALQASNCADCYDSGWFAIDSGTVYTMNHNLGAVPLTATIWGATDSSGSEQYLMNVIEANSGVYGTWMSQVTSTAFTLKTGDNRWVCGSCYPSFAPSSSGYMKVFLSASPCGAGCYDSG